ncbi:MAG: acetate--CoA ligase family protein [Bacteroidales bacterium]|nr:acetate--CoA ligase family protein [Bacteroidales bacterium]MBS3775063.1 acetate--CoA ligase family protein [Bacteroidales bacterium]
MGRRFDIHQKNLKNFFDPGSIALVGTNRQRGTVPGDVFINLLQAEFNGLLFPVSPRDKYISGVKTYKYVTDIEDPVDLAVIVFPSSVVHLALEQCGEKGIKSVIIISAGFREVGGVGIEREKKLMEIAEKYDMSIIGPNCLGIINTDNFVRLNASFARKLPHEGNIAFISQSGALCTGVLDYARAHQIGFSKFISFGNKPDINEIDLLYYLARDEKTKVILIYLEEISDGPGLMQAAEYVIGKTNKPVLLLKSGRTSEGASAAASHTGSLAGSDQVCDAASEQSGIIRCDNIEDMFNIAIAFAYQPVSKSNKVAVITNAGGPGVLVTDAVISEGLKLAKFSENTTLTLQKSLPATANINNPVDVIGDAHADRYNIAMTAVCKDPDVGGVFVILTPQSMTDIIEIAQEVINVSNQYNKPIYASFMGEADVGEGIQLLQRNRIPHYFLPESMAKAFASTYYFNELIKQAKAKPRVFNDVDKKKAHQLLDDAVNSGRKHLPEYDAVKVLETYKLPFLSNGLATSKEEAVQIAEDIGYPVVMKVMSEDIVHKFDVKGVVLNISSKNEAEEAYVSITDNAAKYAPEAHVEGVFVTRQLPKGEEVILGTKQDPVFGPVIMFGLGGIYVEVYGDVSFKVAPVDEKAAMGMIEQIKAYPLLTGFRGRDSYDIQAIKETIMRLSQLALDCPQIKELDINPLIVLEEDEGAFIADAKIML